MIKIEVNGAASDILALKRILQKQYGESYSIVVTESVPEAVQFGASYCSASFILSEKYFDLQSISKLKRPEIIVHFANQVYHKMRNRCYGQWSACKMFV